MSFEKSVKRQNDIIAQGQAILDQQSDRNAAPLNGDYENTLSDAGNAERFTRLYGKDVRFVFEFGKWYVFSEHHWKLDDTGELLRRARRIAQSFYSDAARANDPETAKVIAAHARRSLSLKGLGAMLELVKSEQGQTISHKELDANPLLIGVQNGVIDLHTGQHRSGERADLMTKILPVDYDSTAACPRWIQFVSEIMDGNANLIGYLQRLCGYALTGAVSEQSIEILYGSGANGKSTFLETLQSLFGPDYARMSAPDLLLARKHDRHPTELADLRGARLVVSVETGEGRRLNENLVKQMTGGDTIKARFMRQDFFEFKAEFKLLLATNHKPTIKGTDHAIWRRIHLIPFAVTFSKENRDETLKDKLLAELPGILNWCIEGCLQWQNTGLNPPDEVLSATSEYRKQMDVLADFLSECCVIGKKCQAIKKDFYATYTKWCEDNGETTLTQRQLSERMQERGFTEIRSDYARKWRGVGLLDTRHPDVTDDFHARGHDHDVTDANDANSSIPDINRENMSGMEKEASVTSLASCSEWEEF